MIYSADVSDRPASEVWPVNGKKSTEANELAEPVEDDSEKRTNGQQWRRDGTEWEGKALRRAIQAETSRRSSKKVMSYSGSRASILKDVISSAAKDKLCLKKCLSVRINYSRG